jgi:hypothetical protein
VNRRKIKWGREFDHASSKARKTLQSLAGESWNEHQGDVRFRSFFSQI